MKRAIKRIMIFSFVLCVGFILPVYGGVLQDEIDLEESLRSQAQRTLDGVFGPNNFIVQVDAQLTNPKYEVTYTKESRPKRTKKKAEEYSILPGYSVIKNLSPADIHKLPFDSVTNYIKPRVIRIMVDVLVNKDFPKGRRGRVKSLVRKILSLNEKRGDKVVFKTQKFYVETESAPQQIKIVQSDKLLSYQNLFNFLILLGLVVFIIIYIIIQLRKTDKGEKGGEAGTNISVNPNIELPEGLGGGPQGDLRLSSTPSIKQFFDFIHSGNIDKVIHLIKKEQ
ncbi:hypothetical protein ACFLZV_01385, partial [Candidatus Margulisiibacteriota bacterium]